MKANNRKSKFIIISTIIILGILLIAIQMLIILAEETPSQTQNNNIQVSTGEKKLGTRDNSIKEIIENAGSKYINLERKVYTNIYVNFKNNLYDKNGKSNEKYFNDIIAQIMDLEKNSFYLIDNEKNIKIFAFYDKENYKIRINDIDDFYDETDGETYIDIENTDIVRGANFAVINDLYSNLELHGMAFANTVIVTSEREQLPNGYYRYPNEHIRAKISNSKVLNLIFDEDYEEPISTASIYANTKLENVEKVFKNSSYGSSREGYLCYRTKTEYVFLYGDEVSIYPYKYQENEYFDEYLSDYCETGDLDKLVSDFTTRWSSYFEFEYDAENQNLKLTFPTRGIAMDIIGNNSKGITIYNNYYLTDTVKELIKNNKITLEPDKDLLLITEQKRRESMR